MIDELNAAVKLLSSYLKPLETLSSRSQYLPQEQQITSNNSTVSTGSEDSSASVASNCEDNKCDHDVVDVASTKLQSENCADRNLDEALVEALKAKFEGHWYPSQPSKGSGYRCLKFGAQSLDGAIISACESCGINKADIITSIPNDLILWIDPGEVSYKIGDSVPLTTVYNKPLQASPDENSILDAVSSLCNQFPVSVIVGGGDDIPHLKGAPSALISEQDPNNNTIRSRSAVPFQGNKKLSSGSMGGSITPSQVLSTDLSSAPGIAGSNSFAKQINAISSHVLVTANEFSPHPIPPGINSLAQTRGGHIIPAGMETGPDFFVTSRPTTLPGVKNGGGMYTSPMQNGHHNPHAVSRNANVSRNLGFYWKNAPLSNSRVQQQSASFTSLNPEAAVFSPSVSPEQQLLSANNPSAAAHINAYPNNGHLHNFSASHLSNASTDILGVTGNLVNFQDDTHLHSNIAVASGVLNGNVAPGNASTPPGGRNGIASLVSPTQRFYTSNGLAQLQFQQQAFRGGSPVDYGAPFSRASPLKSALTSSSQSVGGHVSNGATGGSNGSVNQSPSSLSPQNGNGPGVPPPSTPQPPTQQQSQTQNQQNPGTNVTSPAQQNANSDQQQQQRSGHQQLMTADAFAATKFGSTKLKSRKSNINLSQMSATQFEAYMRHKTSTMHSRPPHTNYTDAYPPSNYGSNANNSAVSPQNHQMIPQQASQNSSPASTGSAGGFYGPISPVGRGGSTGSSNSTPSPCGSYPGFPSPAAMSEMMSRGGATQNGAASRAIGRPQMSNGSASGACNTAAVFEQFVQDLCEDPFSQPPSSVVNSFLNSANFNNGNMQPAGPHSQQSTNSPANNNSTNVSSNHLLTTASHNFSSSSASSGASADNCWNHSTALRYQHQLAAAAAASAGTNAAANSTGVPNAFLGPHFPNLASRVGAN